MSDGVQELPPHVQQLWPGEREFASIVFARGPSTAAEIQQRLSKPLTSSSVRATLRRLVGKGILNCAPGRRGRGSPAIYYPTTIPEQAKAKALHRVAADYFGGSTVRLACAALESAEPSDELRDLAVTLASRLAAVDFVT